MAPLFDSPLPFISKPRKQNLKIVILRENDLAEFTKTQKECVKGQIKQADFKAKPKSVLAVTDPETGFCNMIMLGVSQPVSRFDSCAVCEVVLKMFPNETFKTKSFSIITDYIRLDEDEIQNLYIGWGWGHYKFDFYKETKQDIAALVLPINLDKNRIEAMVNSVNTLRNLVNTPANDCGPEELESFTKELAETFGAKTSVILDKELLEQNFPMIYTVGQASPRRPRLIELNWGKEKDAKITLVGKGVCFDTGGLDIKPSAFMRYMKKDMGGAAHALNLAYLIMSLKLPVRLRVLIAAVENSISGEAFRPGDIMKSRKGLFVENTNTDAEGRLILADTLTYACENDPELIIDFATLTGSARAALGPDIPAMFSNNVDIAATLQKISFETEDPVWNMPLWSEYKKHNKSSAADLQNSAGIPGDLMFSALFLESFLTEGKNKKLPNWIHLDCYAWEQTGRAGRPVGAADTGMRAVFAYLEHIYSSK